MLRGQRFRCYLCSEIDGNETPFDPEKHQICMNCGAKLLSLASWGFAAKMGPFVVHIVAEPVGEESEPFATDPAPAEELN